MPNIFLRTSTTDNNPAGSTNTVAFPIPVGVKDGDLIIVGILKPDASITVTPSNSDWTSIGQTDIGISPGIIAFWKIALNEAGHWVFGLSAGTYVIGEALVYGSTDPFAPIEAFSVKTTSSSTSHGVSPISAAIDNEEIALFLGASNSGTYTPATGFSQVLAKTQTSHSALETHRRNLPSAGDIAGFNVTFSAATASASLIIAIRPAIGTLSVDDVRALVVGALPTGVDRVYDLAPGGDFYNYYSVIAMLLKIFGYDLDDIAQTEIAPSRSRYKLSDWERIFGIETSMVAVSGTVAQRQAQIISSWRSVAGQTTSAPELRAALEPLLKYNTADAISVRQTSRVALRDAHSYAFRSSSVSIPGAGSVTTYALVMDSPVVSRGGATLRLHITHTTPAQLTVTLKNPSLSYTKVWAAPFGSASISGSDEYCLYGPEFSGLGISGEWTLIVASSGASGTLVSAQVFVEAIGRNPNLTDGLAADFFSWGVFVDPTLTNHGDGISVTNANVDYQAIFSVIQKFSQSHGNGYVIRGSTALDAGQAQAFPDDPNCIPDAVLSSA